VNAAVRLLGTVLAFWYTDVPGTVGSRIVASS
jgi:hypothetical protein